MSVINRAFTKYTYDTIEEWDTPVWKFAHAALNNCETGYMTIDEITRDVGDRFIDRFGEGGNPSLRSTLANNMSISPDFMKAHKSASRHSFWILTGSDYGVPRPDKAKYRHHERARAKVRRDNRSKRGHQEGLPVFLEDWEGNLTNIPAPTGVEHILVDIQKTIDGTYKRERAEKARKAREEAIRQEQENEAFKFLRSLECL